MRVPEALGIDPDLAWDERRHLLPDLDADASPSTASAGAARSRRPAGSSSRAVSRVAGQRAATRRRGRISTAIGGWWYLLLAEGGTERGHAVTIARGPRPPARSSRARPTRSSATAAPTDPVQNTGHADLVSTADGRWAAVYLGVASARLRPRASTCWAARPSSPASTGSTGGRSSTRTATRSRAASPAFADVFDDPAARPALGRPGRRAVDAVATRDPDGGLDPARPDRQIARDAAGLLAPGSVTCVVSRGLPGRARPVPAAAGRPARVRTRPPRRHGGGHCARSVTSMSSSPPPRVPDGPVVLRIEAVPPTSRHVPLRRSGRDRAVAGPAGTDPRTGPSRRPLPLHRGRLRVHRPHARRRQPHRPDPRAIGQLPTRAGAAGHRRTSSSGRRTRTDAEPGPPPGSCT